MVLTTFINNQRLAEMAGVNYDSEIIQPNPIVYSRTHTIAKQFPVLAQFPSCVLITSFSDAPLTERMARGLPPNVRCWFSNNVVCSHPRVQSVPIGIRLSPETETALREAMDAGRQPPRNLVYLNCWRRIRQSYNPRKGIYEQFGGESWVTTEGGFGHVPIQDFYRQVASHPYVLSPAGAGPDCHRNWEAILLGSIPIVLRQPPLDVLDGLPVLLVDTWAEVTPELLVRELPTLREKFCSLEMERVWFEYWRGRILSS